MRARIIKNAGAPGDVEWMNIRRNITNTCAKIKNIVDFALRKNEVGRIQREKERQIDKRYASVSLVEGIRWPMTDVDSRAAQMDH